MRVLSAVARSMTDWVRDAALIVNRKVDRDASLSYSAPTVSNPPTQAEMQALADHVEALTNRLK